MRCLPPRVNSIFCHIIPGNPDPRRLTARASEQIFNPPEVALAWEYGTYIVTPTVCYGMLFTMGPDSYVVFLLLALWVAFMYVLHRFATLLISKKAMHGSSIELLAERLWGIPLATVLAASCFWGIRCGKLGDPEHLQCYWTVLFVFVTGVCLHDLVLREFGSPADQNFDVDDRSYDETKKKLGYTWFNVNPVHVLKSCYHVDAFFKASDYSSLAGFADSIGREIADNTDIMARVPFEYGKEYLLRLDTPQAAKEILLEAGRGGGLLERLMGCGSTTHAREQEMFAAQ
mmetsp:Transcript_74937/g.214685  ORF Transcript_74937/g.214685 Transcript_74937/m.214685 type:complete len:288 (+) Transcript_74937:41-904(+)